MTPDGIICLLFPHPTVESICGNKLWGAPRCNPVCLAHSKRQSSYWLWVLCLNYSDWQYFPVRLLTLIRGGQYQKLSTSRRRRSVPALSGSDCLWCILSSSLQFPSAAEKELKLINSDPKANHTAIHESTFDYWNSTQPSPFKWQKLVLIFKHILFKLVLSPGSSFSIRPLKDFFVPRSVIQILIQSQTDCTARNQRWLSWWTR